MNFAGILMFFTKPKPNLNPKPGFFGKFSNPEPGTQTRCDKFWKPIKFEFDR